VTNRRAISGALLAIAALVVGGAGCIAINPADGALICRSNGKQCPDNYYCDDTNHCVHNGHDSGVVIGGDDGGSDDLGGGSGLPNGSACSANSDCMGNVCADGYCCDRACGGQCESCSLSGHEGTCTYVTGQPAPPRDACNGSGPCAGSCDGTSKDCTYRAGAICGASCDGTCDSQGNCSTASGGSCPNGYACGTSGCRTSCASNTDCQPNFMCDMPSSTCKRVPESDCLDGVDNNGDGLADCADPTCTAGYECVQAPPPSVPLGLHITSGSCPADYNTATAYHSGLVAGTCSGCSCASYYGATVEVYGSSSTCGGSGPSVRNIGTNNSSFCNTIAVATYQSIAVSVVTADHCAAGGSATQSTPSWSTNDTFCAARTSATCGNANQVCVAKPVSTTVCAAVAAGGTCPTGYATSNGTTYYTGYTPGSCSACGCTVGTNKPTVIGGASSASDCVSGITSSTISSNGANTCDPVGTTTTRAAIHEAFSLANDNCTSSASVNPPTGTGGAKFCCQ
jgi:hypothetical protein